MKKTIINRNWYFKFGENKGDEINIKLNEYSLIGLPHSFGIPYYGENDFYVGYGTYITRSLIVIVIFKTAVFYWSLGQFFKLPKFISTVSIFNLMKAGIPHLTLI